MLKQKQIASECNFLCFAVPPTIINLSKGIVVNEGSNVTLMCQASGKPEPSFTWKLLSPSGKTKPTNLSPQLLVYLHSRSFSLALSFSHSLAHSPAPSPPLALTHSLTHTRTLPLSLNSPQSVTLTLGNPNDTWWTASFSFMSISLSVYYLFPNHHYPLIICIEIHCSQFIWDN